MTRHVLVFCVSFLFCIFSALFAHIYFTVVSRLSSVRSGRARSTGIVLYMKSISYSATGRPGLSRLD